MYIKWHELRIVYELNLKQPERHAPMNLPTLSMASWAYGFCFHKKQTFKIHFNKRQRCLKKFRESIINRLFKHDIDTYPHTCGYLYV